ncbi:N-6 DNA methylase [Desmonostoc muscorum LEGE 12446]|uniref:Eco57I restriction-modification methylase domain-containing protein n=1 Tax=Desmonostoc muscorum TaxID=1179 RepID=UPI001D1588F9|nr:N-6 DNA methylase [Desmonostoc muscorum]MCF2146236.1 N-6 DNA methylase [Desmonostoc muscorum LEGE 12446]
MFFESFAKPEIERDLSVQELVGKVKYLNGGLFLKHHIEEKYQISIVDEAFPQVLDLFGRYSWNLDDTPEGKDDEINPDVLGYIFVKYINQKAFGAYYTRPQITEYLCDRTIHKLIVDRVNDALSDKYKPFEDINELFIKLDTNVCRLLMEDILPNLSILDPACGSGAFLVAAMKTLIQVYSNVLERGGFDAIITNPPWEIFKPQAKEFFAQHNELVTKNKMDIKDFEKEQNKLLQNPIIASTWLEYQSQYPYVSAYYRSSEQYKNQISIVNGKKAGTDINLYKLFTEQCFNLLCLGGECGIVIPSGIYTDLGTKQLREMLFSQTKVTGLLCLENRKEVFEGVHRSFKIVVLTFVKGSITTEFPSAFMRHDVQELQTFPGEDSLQISVDMIRKLSPDSLSVMEFKNEVDIFISKKMLKFPLLGEKIEGKWNLRLKEAALSAYRNFGFTPP